MPKDPTIKKVMVIGSGQFRRHCNRQAAEIDWAGARCLLNIYLGYLQK